MDLKDLIVTPFFLIIIYLLAYRFRRQIDDNDQKIFFIPALTVKITGAIMLGLIYQFYYGGGDTFNFVQLGTIHLYDAFFNAPSKFFGLLISDGQDAAKLYPYSSRIYHFSDPSSFLIIKLASIAGIFSLHSYAVMAISFALFSFSGSWAVYRTVCRIYPFAPFKKKAAWAIFFIPSVFFWGSGLLKDSITFGAVGWLFYAFTNLFIFRQRQLSSFFILVFSILLIKTIKIYILMCLIPALIIWLFFHFDYKIKSSLIKIFSKPLLAMLAILFSYFAAHYISMDSNRYSFENLSGTAKTTYDYLTYMSKIEGGSYYSLGEIDGSPQSFISKAPAAINVTLFRPYLWESGNPIMLLSALESLSFMIFTLLAFYNTGFLKSIHIIQKDPFLIFAITFSFAFAFAVGISTANFGTLVRYKIPILPFYLLFLALLYEKGQRKKITAVPKNDLSRSTVPRK